MKKMNTIETLKYRIKRYQEMRNGTMCQSLNQQLNQLLGKMA